MTITPEILLKLLADQTRLRSIVLMLREGELCVCELTHALRLSQPKISRHLASLRENSLVQDRREGQWVYYRINPELPDWANRLLHSIGEGCADNKPFKNDMQRLNTMKNRPGMRVCA